jgi:hypothetical protein
LVCKNKDNEDAEKAVTHSKFESHEPGKICMSTTYSGAREYEVFILSDARPDDPKASNIQKYQSARFVCRYKNNKKTLCKVEGEQKPEDLCDTSF